jgi:ferric-dicitrate binding protein FerR (iron transport regulator)
MNEERDIEQLMQQAGRRPAVPEDIKARVRANVRDAWKTEVDARRTRRRFMVAAPLAAAASIAVVVMFLQPKPPIAPVVLVPMVATFERVIGDVRIGNAEGKETARILAGSDVSTRDGRAAIRMGDGTSVRVDKETRVRLDGVRQLVLDGGAIYIDTAHSGMSVRTPFGIVRDVGTKFEIRVTASTVRVRVRDGEVAIGEHHAHRGEQLDIRTGHVTMSRITTWGDDWAWLNDIAPGFAVEGRRVAEFVTWFAAETGMDVRYDSTETSRKAADAVLHGSIGTLRPVAAADAVLPTAGLRADVKDGVMTIRRQ